MVGENFEIYSSQLAKNALKLSTMVGENFGIYSSQLAKNALKYFTGNSIFQLFQQPLYRKVYVFPVFPAQNEKKASFPAFPAFPAGVATLVYLTIVSRIRIMFISP